MVPTSKIHHEIGKCGYCQKMFEITDDNLIQYEEEEYIAICQKCIDGMAADIYANMEKKDD